MLRILLFCIIFLTSLVAQIEPPPQRFIWTWDKIPDPINMTFVGYGFFESDHPNADLTPNMDKSIRDLWNYEYTFVGSEPAWIHAPDPTKITYHTMASYYSWGASGEWSAGCREIKHTPNRVPVATIELIRKPITNEILVALTIVDDPCVGVNIEGSVDLVTWTLIEKIYTPYEETITLQYPITTANRFYRASRTWVVYPETPIPPLPWPPQPIDPSLPVEMIIINDEPAIIPKKKPHQIIPTREDKKALIRKLLSKIKKK